MGISSRRMLDGRQTGGAISAGFVGSVQDFGQNASALNPDAVTTKRRRCVSGVQKTKSEATRLIVGLIQSETSGFKGTK